ncbi:phage antirepressor N-terminal domain-containing protein [Sphingobium yanoikuyae]|uniref:phage antirepressor N-terminal domain-containing protein n=1 Tax=Sphingobium yanoikuyae TaxID=13690 RepID=UPI0028B0C472|nr:phage antirepressor N-terminal domain-containing protein [Sphingobium yanoikuyae]
MAIDFHGDQLITFQKDGEPHVAMRRVVENIGLSWSRQREKLSEGDRFSCALMCSTGADGKSYEMLAMPVAKLPLWLATINPNKITDPVKRQKVEWYQAESAIVLHDYWTKGIAIRGDMDGMVTSIDEKVMGAIGGMLKGIVNKSIRDLLPTLVDARMLETQASVSHGVTAGEVIQLAGIENRKGLRGLPRRVSDQLRRFCAEKSIAVKMGRLGSNSAYVFDLIVAREWLAEGGKQFIMRLVEEKRGQGALKLVQS